MNGELIFYAARKTSLCERSLKKSFTELDMRLAKTSFATDNHTLGTLVSASLDKNDIVFVTGGLDIGGGNDSVTVFSRVFADNRPQVMKKIANEEGSDGYLFATDRQAIVLLPDEPEQIEHMMQGPLCGFIKRYMGKE